ncbi:oxidoreductase YdbC [Kutzneria sp. 744]|nr:oxidoreductase YdbC [Kutzneria sp. 744]
MLRRAVDLGVTFIDTADSYGPDTNEQIIRQALHPYPEDLVIGTKGGLLRSDPSDRVHDDGGPHIVALARPAYLRQQVEMSLRNLGLDRIDLYQLHRIDLAVPLADQLGELVGLQKERKIRHIGISGHPAVTVDLLVQAREIADIVAVQNPYNVADRTSEDVLCHVDEHDTSPSSRGFPSAMAISAGRAVPSPRCPWSTARRRRGSPSSGCCTGRRRSCSFPAPRRSATARTTWAPPRSSSTSAAAVADAVAWSTAPPWRPSASPDPG